MPDIVDFTLCWIFYINICELFFECNLKVVDSLSLAYNVCKVELEQPIV